MKLLALIMLCGFSISAHATEPARRPRIQPTSIHGTALCKDDQYQCMYKCTMDEGSLCQPTRSSDVNCTQHAVKSWTGGGRVIVMSFDNYEYPDMGCQVLTPPKTNLVCGNTRFGWDCWIGEMHVDND